MTRGPDPQSFERLTAVEPTRATLLGMIDPLPARALPLDAATGRVTAAAVEVFEDRPPFATGRRDGWAIAAHQSVGATPYAPVSFAGPLVAVRAGDRVPDGADAILPPQALLRGPLGADILQATYAGHAVRAVGEDLRRGRTLLPPGHMLRRDQAAILALAGIDVVSVRAPRLTLTGNGLSPFLVQLFEAWTWARGAVIGSGDDTDLTVVLASPGYAGTRRAVDDVLSKAGTMIAHGLAAAPGEAIGVGYRQSGERIVPVVVVPATPEDCLAAWLLLVQPCLIALAGLTQPPRCETLPLARKIASTPGVMDLVLLRRDDDRDVAQWDVLAVGDAPWSAILRAEAVALLPPGSEGLPPGAPLTATML